MLTHGWRRFKWQDVLENKKIARPYLPEFEGPIISGNIENIQKAAPEKNIQTYLSIPGKNYMLYSASSDSGGKLNYFTKNFYGPVEIVAQAQSDAENKLRINIESPYSEYYSSRSAPSFNTAPFENKQLQTKSVNMQVQDIYTSEKNNIYRSLSIDTIPFYGKPEKKYALDNYVRFPTMEEVLREYVTEINVYRRNKNFSIALIRRYPP